MTQLDVSRATGMTLKHFSSIERGVGNPQVDTLEKVAKALRTPIWRLLVPMAQAPADAPPELDRCIALLERITAEGLRQVLPVLERFGGFERRGRGRKG
jgi:transcriptional regulator with XRE-family HTH domain